MKTTAMAMIVVTLSTLVSSSLYANDTIKGTEAIDTINRYMDDETTIVGKTEKGERCWIKTQGLPSMSAPTGEAIGIYTIDRFNFASGSAIFNDDDVTSVSRDRGLDYRLSKTYQKYTATSVRIDEMSEYAHDFRLTLTDATGKSVSCDTTEEQ